MRLKNIHLFEIYLTIALRRMKMPLSLRSLTNKGKFFEQIEKIKASMYPRDLYPIVY
jgi:hypothetical protein